LLFFSFFLQTADKFHSGKQVGSNSTLLPCESKVGAPLAASVHCLRCQCCKSFSHTCLLASARGGAQVQVLLPGIACCSGCFVHQSSACAFLSQERKAWGRERSCLPHSNKSCCCWTSRVHARTNAPMSGKRAKPQITGRPQDGACQKEVHRDSANHGCCQGHSVCQSGGLSKMAKKHQGRVPAGAAAMAPATAHQSGQSISLKQ
jgi:hypothetical protein